MTPGTAVSVHSLLAFVLIFTCWIPPADSAICAGLTYYTANTTGGTFSSPNYPSDYTINIYCSWLIEATDSIHVIRLDVNASSLEDPDGSGSCTYDYIRVYDGNDMSSTLLGEVCGTNTSTLYSTSTKMLIIFRSDDNTVSTGFLANYESGISWTTPSSKDYTIIIAASSSSFFLVCCIIAACCIRSKLKKKKAMRAADKHALSEGEETAEKCAGDGKKSLFNQRILPSKQEKRLQPIEAAVETENTPVTKTVAASAAAAAVTRQKELKEREKREKKKEQERQKAEEKVAKQEEKRKAAEEKQKAKAQRSKIRKVGFEEQTEDIGVAPMTQYSSAFPGELETVDVSDSRCDSKGVANSKERVSGSASSERTAIGNKIVLLPTVVMVGSAETVKRKKVEGQWDKVSGNDLDPLASSFSGSQSLANMPFTSTLLEGDEGIHMDYEGGESGKSSPSSRPSTNTAAQREAGVVTPSLVTSVITDSPMHYPIPIEAPGTAGDLLDRSAQRASTARGNRPKVTTTLPPPVKDAFLKADDPKDAFKKALDRQRKSSTPAESPGGRNLASS